MDKLHLEMILSVTGAEESGGKVKGEEEGEDATEDESESDKDFDSYVPKIRPDGNITK